MSEKIDPDVTGGYPSYMNIYQADALSFNGGWHKIGCEWSPDQIKFYVDDVLKFRLEGNYLYTYTNMYGSSASIQPVHEMNLPMPILLSYGILGGDPSAAPQGTTLAMDVNYVRYYTLKKDCNTIIKKPGSPSSEDICGTYIERVYDSVILGSPTCSGCSIEPKSCHTSVRAKGIKLLDGFKVSAQGSFYACDIECDDL